MNQQWLFEGVATAAEPGRPALELKISFPKHSQDNVFACTVEFRSDGKEDRQEIMGVGALNAIANATAYARRELDSLYADYSFGLDRYEVLFPLVAPAYYGKDIQDDVENYIRASIEREESRMTEKFRKKYPDYPA